MKALFTFSILSIIICQPFVGNGQIVWNELNAPPATMEVFEIGPNGNLYTLGGGNPMTLIYSDNDGGAWQTEAGSGLPNGAFAFDKRLHITNAGSILVHATTSNSIVYRSTDGGATFADLGPGNGLPSGFFVMGFTSTPNGDVYAYGSTLYRSDDDGLNWIQVSSQGFSKMTSTADGRLFGAAGADLLFSVDQGQSWSGIAPIGVGVSNVAGITVGMDTVLYTAGSDDLVISSTELGANWSLANDGIIGTNPMNHIAAALNTAQVVVSRPFEVYFSPDGGISWTQEEMGLNFSSNVAGLRTSPNGRFYLYFLQGLYKLSLPTSVEEIQVQDGSWVFPNPSAGLVNVTIDLKERASVLIEIVDLTGRTLIHRDMGIINAGTSSIQLANEADLKGTFLLRCTAGVVVRTQQVVFE